MMDMEKMLADIARDLLTVKNWRRQMLYDGASHLVGEGAAWHFQVLRSDNGTRMGSATNHGGTLVKLPDGLVDAVELAGHTTLWAQTHPAKPDFSKPKKVDTVAMIFGDTEGLMPALTDIPAEFCDGGSSPWLKFQAKWFYEGLAADDMAKLVAKPGIELNTALRHLKTIQGSFNPKHEHKVATIAYLASLWFEEWKP